MMTYNYNEAGLVDPNSFVNFSGSGNSDVIVSNRNDSESELQHLLAKWGLEHLHSHLKGKNTVYFLYLPFFQKIEKI